MTDSEVRTSEQAFEAGAFSSNATRLAQDYAKTFDDREHVRDLVFANQISELERRYARVEERLLKDLSNMRAETNARLDGIERHMRSECESLAQRLAEELDSRQAADSELSEALKTNKIMFSKDTEVVRQALAKSERDWRQALLDATKTLSDEVRRVHADLSVELSEEVAALDHAKVAKTKLAAMFSDMIGKLNNGNGAI